MRRTLWSLHDTFLQLEYIVEFEILHVQGIYLRGGCCDETLSSLERPLLVLVKAMTTTLAWET